MKRFLFISVVSLCSMMLMAVYCERHEEDETKSEVTLAASPSAQKISKDGKASFTFSVTMFTSPTIAANLADYTTTVTFEATGGTVSPSSATADAKGNVTVTFTTPDPEGFTGGTVKGTVLKIKENKKDGAFKQGTLATATATVLPLDAEDPNPHTKEPIYVVDELQDNTYAVQKKGGDVAVYPLSQQYSRWYVGRSYTDKTKQALKIELMDEDPDDSTKGWGMNELPVEIANKLTTINQEFMQKYPWAASKFGTFRTGKEVNVRMGEGGNVKLDGSSQIWIKERPSGTKAYSGLYEFLFVYVFENETWDSETQTYIPDDEYTIYGKAIVEQDFPVLNYFQLTPESDWVQVGKSVTVDADWTDGADFDMSKVKLIGQTKGYSSSEDVDEGYFKWDASSATLTSLKSSDNQSVYLKFAYEGTDMKTSCQIATGPGWPFTSFTFNKSVVDVTNKYFIDYLEVTAWEPANEEWDYYCLELIPDAATDGMFYLEPQGNCIKFYVFTQRQGTYTVGIRSRSNHDAKAYLTVNVPKLD